MKRGVREFQRAVVLLPLLLLVAWSIMVVTHEVGHVIGGYCSGGKLVDLDLRPWHLPTACFGLILIRWSHSGVVLSWAWSCRCLWLW